jgi:hypothetical protein
MALAATVVVSVVVSGRFGKFSRRAPKLQPEARRRIPAHPPRCLRDAYILVAGRSVSRGRPRGGRIKRFNFHKKFGAGEEIRTLDPNLGKVVLYH